MAMRLDGPEWRARSGKLDRQTQNELAAALRTRVALANILQIATDHGGDRRLIAIARLAEAGLKV